MEKIKLNNTILHILDSFLEVPVLSTKELDIEREISEFLEKHIVKIIGDGDLKNARFYSDGNEVYHLINRLSQNEDLFVETSKSLANKLFLIMKQNPDIPPGDIAFSIFEADGQRYFSIIKFNYRNSFTHYVTNTEQGSVNLLIKQKATLPLETQKIEECAIINLSSLEPKILEKQYEICGDKEFYFSKLFLKCSSDLSYLQKIKILDKTASKLSKKHFNEDFEKVSKLRSCLAEKIEESRDIEVDKVAGYVFGENSEFKKEYIEEVKKAGVIENAVTIPETYTPSKKLKTQKLKTDSGIEINFPSHFYNNSEVMEFINNPDGTISILIKNVSKVVNR